MNFIFLLVVFPLIACGGKDLQQTVGIFKIEAPTGEPVVGMALRVLEPSGSEDTKYKTDDSGFANVTFEVEEQPATFILQSSELPLYQNLYIFGILPREAESFQYTTFIGPRSEARLIGHIINLPYNKSNAYVVVGIDVLEDSSKGLQPSNLKPAVNASATMSGDIQYGDPFVFTPRIQQPGNTIEKHGSSWITFPDVTPGEAEIIVTPPDGNRCGISPGFIESFGQPMKIKTYADSITIVSFVCTGGIESSLES